MIGDATRDRAARLLAAFRAAGAEEARPPILLPAGPLLDLYGEDIRARAFTTHDPLRGEAMLRPDMTVPVVEAHMASGGGPARLCYAGEVFRRQEEDADRPREYLQVGIECLGGADPAGEDALVLATIRDALAPWGPEMATGDIGLLIAAVEGLDASPRRRAALRRHLSRPGRFRRLLERFAASARPRAVLDRVATEGAGAVVGAEPALGLRAPEEVEDRLRALAEDALAPPLDARQAEAVEAVAAWRGTMAAAVTPLRALAATLPGLAAAVDRLEARAEAFAAAGIDPARLRFAPAEGRSSLEYYDGMTFVLSAGGHAVAVGGRYDALTAALGEGRRLPAVGGVIRPGLLGGPA